MNFYSCLDLPRAEARIHEKKSNYLKAILENHQNRSTINRRRAADLPYYTLIFYVEIESEFLFEISFLTYFILFVWILFSILKKQ